jgi:hypothetical protein
MLATIGAFGFAERALAETGGEWLKIFQGEDVLKAIVDRATREKWIELATGDLMGKIAKELEGTPYVAHTLELSADREVCSVNLKGLDCVTFFETTLDLARMLKKGGRTSQDLLKEVQFTRYRGGAVGDYSTRLHYTTDWFVDNQKKHVVKVLSDLPGAEPFTQKVGFMSSHPDKYRQLAAHPELIAKIKRQEKTINSRSALKFIAMDKLAAIEPLLKTGDIVGICTSQPGIDIAHTGLIYRTEDGVAHFMDASSGKTKMKVTIEPGPISGALTWSSNLTGVMFARPLEPRPT